MFAKFFIDRPIFAWVIALVILLGGALALRQLPVASYPAVAPPALAISVSYPGAAAQVVEETAVALIEQYCSGSLGAGLGEHVPLGLGQVQVAVQHDTRAHRQPALAAHPLAAHVWHRMPVRLECLQQGDPGSDDETLSAMRQFDLERLAVALEQPPPSFTPGPRAG